MITEILAMLDAMIQKNAHTIMNCQRRSRDLIRIEHRWAINENQTLKAKAQAKLKINQEQEKILAKLQTFLKECRREIQAIEE